MSIELAELERPLADALPEGWRKAALSDVADVNPETLRASTSPDFTFGYIDISQIEAPGQCAGWTEHAFIDAPSRARRKVQAGDILVSTVRPYLRSFAQVPEADLPLVASTGFAVVRAGANADQQFLYQHILHNGFIDHLTPRMTGSNYPAVSAGDVEAYPILLPPVAEQRKIAEVLRSVDETIAAALAQSQSIVRLKSQLLLDLIRDADGDEHSVDAQVQVLPGFAFKSDLFLSGDSEEGLPLIRIRDLRTHSPECRYAGTYDHAFLVKRNDILVGMDGTFEAVRWRGEDALLNQRVLKVWPSLPQLLDDDYLFYRLQPSLAEIEASIGATTVKHLSTKDLKRLCWNIPPIKDQKQAAGTLRALDDGLDQLGNELDRLALLKKSLSADLLSGRVRVPA